jgi:Flp pilus assembly protein TadG
MKTRLTGLEFALIACLLSIVFFGALDLWKLIGGLG